MIQGQDAVGRNMFLSKALEKILEEKDVRRTQHMQLKKACESALEEIRSDGRNIAEKSQQNSSNHTLPLPKSMASGDTERYFLPFELALQSKNPRFATLSLDCLQKLIAYGHFTGNKVDATNTSRRLMDRLVEVVCECFNNGRAEDAVQLQIVKLLLTIIASHHVEVHGESLLLVIRTCYNIHLFSREKVTQETASGSLVQMINKILSRMEEQPEGSSRHGSLRGRSVSQLSDSESARERSLVDGAGNAFENGDHDSGIDADNVVVDPEVAELISSMLASVVTDVDGPAAADLRSVPPSPSLRPRGNSVDTQSLQSVDSGENVSGDEPSVKQHCTVWEKDAYNVFRSLCKLSMKAFKEPADPKAVDFRSKVLSLKLIHSMLQNAGPVFRFHPMFIDAIKKYLCVSLSKNGVTSSADVFRLSLSIFLELLGKFKTYLKMQIEIFFRDIFLNILESSATSFTNKWTMMEALTKICSDAQCVVDLYVNYDCDQTAANLFARIVNDLAKIAQGTTVVDLTITPQQAQRMRHKGYQCIVAVLNCMVEWSKELYVIPHQLSNLADPERSTSEDPDKSSGQVTRNSSSPSFVVGSVAKIRSPGDSPSHLEERKQQKEIVEQGIDVFNKKPKKGLQFLQEHGIVGITPTDIAAFLHKEERLDKTLVGDFLSDNVPYSRDIMHAYIDLMDFSGRDIVQALRVFLEGFRLPGEAQKVDRLMEKFASRYCENNPDLGLFASADTAYVLAFSIIMLTTDLHSPQVKHKMTREQYVKMNRGINDQKDLPEEYLTKIYHEIADHEIKMKTAPPPKPKNSTTAATPKQRQLIYHMEMNQVATAAKALMENVSHVQASFTSAKHSEHVRPMFKVCWGPFLAAFSLGIQDSDDVEINQFCLEGFRYAIRVACIFHLTMERDAYIQALSRFTLLTASSPLSEMKAKNVDTIKTLISVAQADGNYLGHCWLEILKCVSQLELAQLIGSGVKMSKNSSSQLTPRGLSRPSLVFANSESTSSIFDHEMFRSKVDQQRLTSLNESMEEARSQNMVVAVDRIFTSSITLDGDAIVDFVRALCQVSMEELHSSTHPRMFSLQKIVEISYYNMDRIRLQWSRIWQVLGEHFNEVGCKSNEEIASFAIDSLRQLSMKFLEKGEFAHFRFQKDFLRPFEHIMKSNRSPVIRDMIVHCITQMVSSKPGNIKSGWKNVFSVLHYSAGDSDPDLVELAFRTTTKIITQHFELYFTNIIESFQDSVKCLAEFACNMNFPDISMEAIRLIRVCARYVAEKPQVFREHALDFEDKSDSSERVWVKGWFPILLGLSVVVNRCKLDVRTRALTVLFEIIKTFGHSFASGWWKDLFQVLFRLFDDLKLPQNHMEKAEWMTTTCSHALFSIVDVMTQYFDTLGKLLLDDVCGQLKWCITQDNEQLARSGTNCFETLVLSSGPKFDAEVWRKTCQTLASLLKLTLPTELMEMVHKESPALRKRSSGNHLDDVASIHNQLSVASADTDDFQGRKFGSRSVADDPVLSPVIVKCTVQLELIQAVDNIVFFPATSRKEDAECLAIAESGKPPTLQSPTLVADSGMYSYMSSDQLFDLVRSLLEVYNFCKSFDMSEEFRARLSQTQSVFKAKRTLPGLLRQEINSITCCLRILFRIYGDAERGKACHDKAQAVLLSVCREAVSYFCSLPSETYRETWRNVLILVFVKIMRLDDPRFMVFASDLYNDMCLLLTVAEQAEIKNLLRWFFSRCGGTFQIVKSK